MELGRFMSFREMYSASTAAATDTAVTSSALRPNRITEAIRAGVRAMITSSMMERTPVPLRRWGDEDTNSFSIIPSPPSSVRF